MLLIVFLAVALFFTFSQAYAYTEITNCTTITSPGEYRLTQDIIDFPGDVCINIKSNDIILDCQGHVIDGDVSSEYSFGINIDGYSNITIKNCVLGEWSAYRIYLYHTSNVRILNCSFTYGSFDYNGEPAIYFTHSDNCFVDNITSYGMLYIAEATIGCYLNNIYLSGRYYAGITIESSSGIVINNTRIIEAQGISITNSDHINVINSYINTVPHGIYLYQTEYCNFNNIKIYYASDAINLNFCNYNNFTNITINNFGEGIWLDRWSFGNVFTNVNIIDGGTGVYVRRESSGNYFKGLTIRNTSYGIVFYDLPFDNVFEDFTISDITGNGIWLTQVQSTNEFRNGRIERIHPIVGQEESSGIGIRLEDAANQIFWGIIIKNSDNCGISLWDSGDNLFYNNIFMNKNNTCFGGVVYPNYWNTTLKRGKNILGGPFIGGNFWGRPDGKSILDELKYAIMDGIYDHPYDLLGDGTNVDYLPLARYVAAYREVGLGATARAIARINPFAVLIFVLMPVIIGEGIINTFEGVKVNEPLKAAIRLLILIISLALFAAAF